MHINCSVQAESPDNAHNFVFFFMYSIESPSMGTYKQGKNATYIAGADPGGGDWVSSHPSMSLKCRRNKFMEQILLLDCARFNSV